MTDSSSKIPIFSQKVSAKVALNTLRTSDHALGRPLALCMMFESAENQVIVASVFELAITLDAALHIPKEKMLAAIRIQWWADALDRLSEQNVTLLARLQTQFQIRCEFQSQLQVMIGKWQTACYDDNRNSAAGWAEAWRLVAIQLGHISRANQSAEIGYDLHHLIRGQTRVKKVSSISSDIKSLQHNDQGSRRSWLYLAACLNQKLQHDRNNSKSKNIHVSLAEPALVWRILSWYFIGPPK